MKIQVTHSSWTVWSPYLSVFSAAALLLCALAPNPVQAGNDTWTGGGGDNNWSDGANWGGTPPSPNDLLFFDGTTRLNATNDFAAGTIFNNITFNSTAGSFTLGGNSVTLTNPADGGAGLMIGGSITNSSVTNETVALPLTLGPGAHFIETEGGGPLNVGAPVTRKTGGVLEFVPNAGTINLTGSGLVNANGILGGWGFYGNDWASLDGSGNIIAYTGYTPIIGGAIVSSPTSNVRYIGETNNITAANGTAINTLLNQQSAARTLTITGVLRLGANGGIYRDSSASAGFTVTGGNLTTAGAGGELTFGDASFIGTANNLTIASVITNDTGNAPVSVNIMGYVVLNGANTYSGGTFINQGRVQNGNVGAYGTGKVTVLPGGEAFINTAGTYVNAFDIAGYGTTETSGTAPNNGSPGAIRMGVGATAIITNKVTFHGNTRISTSNGGGPQINGQISGDAQLEFTTFATDASILQLGNANVNASNNWPGGTVITAAIATRKTTLRLGANEQIPDGPGHGDLTLNGSLDWARFDLNGHTETINGLISGVGPSANLQVTNSSGTQATLILGNNNATATFGGVIQDGANVLNITKIGSGTQTFTGANNFKGTNTVSGGTLVYGAGAFPPATPPLTINSNGILDLSAVSGLGLGTNPSLSMANGTIKMAVFPSVATLSPASLVAGGATNLVAVSFIGPVASYPAQFPIIKATTVSGVLNFGLAGSLPATSGTPFAGFISNNVANNSVDLVLTSGPPPLQWVGFSSGANNSAWDTATPNWRLNNGVATTYTDSDFVQFDDTASNSLVTLNQTVVPGSLTVTNNLLNYTINDLGGQSINGGATLSKQGTGMLTLDNTGVNGFTGGVVIGGGTLQVGNLDSAGSLPTTGPIIDNGTLAFARNDTVTVPNVISGKGGVTVNGGSTEIVLLASPNTYTGAVNVTSGTLQVGDNNALGTSNGIVTIASGATVDVNGSAGNTRQLTNKIFVAAGPGVGNNGAIVNNGSDSFPTISQLTLTSNTTFGGTARWDLRAPAGTTGNPATATLSTGGHPYNVTKVGANFFGLVSVTVDPALGNIDILGGTMDVEGNTTSLGDPAHTLTVESGAILYLFAPTNRFNKQLAFADQSTLSNNNGANLIIGPMTVIGNAIFNIGGASLTLSNTIGGTGSITKSGGSPLFLNGDASGLTNGFTISGGNVALNGLLGASLTNASGANLTGTGTNLGLTDISGDVFPGASNVVGTLTVSNLILEAGAMVGFDLGATATPGGTTNDLVVVNGNLVINGNQLNINPLGLLKTGQPYVLFTYTGTLTDNSDFFVPGVDSYTFTISTNTPGQITLTASGGPPVWRGDSVTDNNWSDSANWDGITVVSGDALYFAGNNRLNNTNDTTVGNFYGPITFNTDAGAYTLNGNPVTLQGGMINNSPNQQTIDLGLNFGTPCTLSGTSNTLIIGGGLTNTAIGTNSIILSGSGILTNILVSSNPTGTNTIFMADPKANWVLVDNPTSTPMTNPWPINIQAGTFTIGVGSSAPTWSSTDINGAPQDNQVGLISNNVATLVLSNGTYSTVARLNTATVLNSTGVVSQVGGTFNIGQQFQGANGANAGEQSILSIRGGTMNVGNTAGQIYVASRGNGSFTVSGGTVACATLDVSRNANGNAIGSIGVVNLNGGVLSVGRVGTATANSQAGPPSSGTQPSAAFNFNGGTLLANTNVSANPFFQGSQSGPAIPITTTVKAGGAIIDDGGFAISILEPLRHDATLGNTLDGGLQKNGAGTLTLSAANTYTGPTVVNNGTLAVTGSLAATAVTVGNNGTLAGTGSFGSNVTVTVGGTISPAGTNTLGTLTIASNLVLQGTAIMEVSKASLTNDLLKANSITYGGTLAVTNLAGTLAPGDAFKLFTAAALGGGFTNFALASPGSGLAWDTSSLLTSGTIKVVATVNPNPTNITFSVSAGNLTLSWPADHIGWHLQVQTNSLSVGLSTNWVEVPGATSTNQIVFPISSANPTVFYRLFLP